MSGEKEVRGSSRFGGKARQREGTDINHREEATSPSPVNEKVGAIRRILRHLNKTPQDEPKQPKEQNEESTYYVLHVKHSDFPKRLSGISMDGDQDWSEDLHDESLLHVQVPVDVPLEDEVLANQKPFMPPQIKHNPPKATPKKNKSNANGSSSSSEHGKRKEHGHAFNGLTSTVPAVPQCVTVLSDTSIKEPRYDSVATYLQSSEWKGHQTQLKDWRRLIQDRETLAARPSRLSLSSNEPIAPTTRMGAPLTTAMHSSARMIIDDVGASHDDLLLDPREVEQRKKVLQRILETAKRHS